MRGLFVAPGNWLFTTRRSRFLRSIFLLTLPVFGIACGGGSNANSGNPSSETTVVNPWVLRFTSNSPVASTDSLTVDVNLSQSAAQFQSTAMQVGRACIRPSFSSETVTGSINGNNLSLTVSFGGVTMLLTGTLSADGNSMNGTYTMSGACGNDTGTWTATKVSRVNGSYAGSSQLASNPALNVSVTASFTSGTGDSVTGTFSFNSTCFHNLTATGTQIGSQFGGSASDTFGDTIEFASIGDAHTINGIIIVDTGTCAGADATIILGQ